MQGGTIFDNLVPNLKLEVSYNYPIWKYAIKTLLKGLDAFQYVDGTFDGVVVGDGGVGQERGFNAVEDSAVMALINSTLSVPTMAMVAHCDSAREVWLALEEVFGRLRDFSISCLDEELRSLVLTADGSVEAFVIASENLRAKFYCFDLAFTDENFVSLLMEKIPAVIRVAMEGEAGATPPVSVFYVKLMELHNKLLKGVDQARLSYMI